jgi:hypothetical protein
MNQLQLFLLVLSFVSSNTLSNIRHEFTTRFYDQCYHKYSFFEEYWKLFEEKPRKYVIFEYDRAGLQNGGIGDRFAGVITAFLHALRFRRLLFLSAENNMPILFTPFHPDATPDPRITQNNRNYTIDEGRMSYRWDNWGEWSGYNQFLQESPFPPRELNLTDCHIFPTDPDATYNHCGLVYWNESDLASYPIIRFVSNRAFLCRYLTRKDLPTYSQFLEILHLTGKEEGKEEINLFEIGGCIMRFLMWPTDELWSKVDHFYSSRSQEQQSTEVVPSTGGSSYSSDHSILFTLQGNSVSSHYYQIGIQYRCGDFLSFNEEYRHLRYLCGDHDSEDVTNLSDAFSFGRPLTIARCVQMLMEYYYEELYENKGESAICCCLRSIFNFFLFVRFLYCRIIPAITRRKFLLSVSLLVFQQFYSSAGDSLESSRVHYFRFFGC